MYLSSEFRRARLKIDRSCTPFETILVKEMKMEDDDFGFTKREDSVLRKVLKDCEAKEEIGSLIDRNEKKLRDENSSTTGAEGTGGKKNVDDDGGSVIPDESEGVSSHEVDGRKNSSADDEKLTPETGTEEANKRSSCQTQTSVNLQTPNIPNVVEYHLKVKTQSEQRQDKSEDQQIDNKNCKIKLDKMRTDNRTPLSSRSDKKILSNKLSMLSIDNNVFEGSTDLPQVFQVKYLGSHDARGLWGIKHTRKPVDNMVASAKSLPADTILPLVKLIVSEDGVSLLPLGKRKFEAAGISKTYPIESISYGVQDLVYTRVFSMIVVRDNGNFRRVSPFECHAFVCESKHHARQLTYGLATAFQIYSQNVKTLGKTNETTEIVKKRFAIDLRSPEEIETDLNLDSEA